MSGGQARDGGEQVGASLLPAAAARAAGQKDVAPVDLVKEHVKNLKDYMHSLADGFVSHEVTVVHEYLGKRRKKDVEQELDKAKGQIESLQAALRDERKRYKKQSKILAEQRRLLTWL